MENLTKYMIIGFAVVFVAIPATGLFVNTNITSLSSDITSLSSNITSLDTKIENLINDKEFSNNINSIKKSVVRIESFYRHSSNPEISCAFGGTGFFITNDGYILTASHTVDDGNHEPCSGFPYQVNVILENGEKVSATVHKTNVRKSDLGIIKIDGSFTSVEVIDDSSSVVAGQRIGFVGHPYGLESQIVSQGIVSFSGIENDIRVMRVNAVISSGGSGSPVFLSNTGNVIGVYTTNIAPLIRPINSANAPTPEAKYIVDTLGSYVSDTIKETAQTGVGIIVPIDDSIISEISQ